MAKYLGSSYPGRREFERGANLLKESIENKRISLARGMITHLGDSLSRVRTLPNGRINLNTIDELVRSTFHILASDNFREMYERKSKYGMPSPISRAEFEHNVFLLVEDIERHKNNQSYLENRFGLWGNL